MPTSLHTLRPPTALQSPPPRPPTSLPPPPPYPQVPVPDSRLPPGVVLVEMPMPLRLGKEPQMMTCPMCNNQIITVTQCRPSPGAWIIVIVLILFFWVLAWIPCIICQDVDHQCPVCGAPVGYYRDPTCR